MRRQSAAALSFLGLLLAHRPAPSQTFATSLDRPSRSPDQILSSVDDALQRSNLPWDRCGTLDRIDAEHARDAAACPSLPAEVDPSTPNALEYEWISVHVPQEGAEGRQNQRQRRPLGIRTTGGDGDGSSNPALLDAPSIRRIRSAAERQWNDSSSSSSSSSGGKSRFTYQRRGNYEAHLNDLAEDDPAIRAIAEELLRDKVYPLIREAFGSTDLVVDDLTSLRFCVYDSLVIRYNATEANNVGGMDSNAAVVGAGQPLHRDLGLISVNIMLNSEEEFAAGGTAFENQFGEVGSQPLKPVGPGHALSHLSSERHAGSCTTKGVRDILVIFITATNADSSSVHWPTAPRMERCARLKAKARGESQRFDNAVDAALCRAAYQRLAAESFPGDGEAWHYLGMALRDYHLAEGSDDASGIIKQLSLDCLLLAAELTPCDGRLFNNLGLLFGQLYTEQNRQAYFDQAQQCYNKSEVLHRAAQLAGCDIGREYDASILNHGLFLANLDRFHEAADVLARATRISDFWRVKGDSHALTDSEATHLRMLEDAHGLRTFCEMNSPGEGI